jgi:hypothetical protein
MNFAKVESLLPSCNNICGVVRRTVQVLNKNHLSTFGNRVPKTHFWGPVSDNQFPLFIFTSYLSIFHPNSPFCESCFTKPPFRGFDGLVAGL